MTLAEGLEAERKGKGSVRFRGGLAYWSDQPPRFAAGPEVPESPEDLALFVRRESLERRRRRLLYEASLLSDEQAEISERLGEW